MRSRLRYDGAKANVARAEQALRFSDTRVAEVVADVLRRALPDVPSRATFVRTAESPEISELPFLLIVQSSPTTTHGTGTLSGEVDVIYYRTPLHTVLDPAAIQSAAFDLGFRAVPVGSVHTNAGRTDLLKLRVERANSRTPLIPTIEERHLGALGNRFASDLAANVRWEGQAITLDRDTAAYVSSHIVALPTETQVVAEDIAPDGTRTLTVETSVLVRTKKQPSGSTVAERADGVIANLDRGLFIAGLGILTSVTKLKQSSLTRKDDEIRRALATVNVGSMPVNAQTLGFEDAHQWILRATFSSSTGFAPAQHAA